MVVPGPSPMPCNAQQLASSSQAPAKAPPVQLQAELDAAHAARMQARQEEQDDFVAPRSTRGPSRPPRRTHFQDDEDDGPWHMDCSNAYRRGSHRSAGSYDDADMVWQAQQSRAKGKGKGQQLSMAPGSHRAQADGVSPATQCAH